MENFIVAGLLVIIIGAVVFYLVREKKKGVKCIGCPYAKQCAGKCGGKCNSKCSDHSEQIQKDN